MKSDWFASRVKRDWIASRVKSGWFASCVKSDWFTSRVKSDWFASRVKDALSVKHAEATDLTLFFNTKNQPTKSDGQCSTNFLSS